MTLPRKRCRGLDLSIKDDQDTAKLYAPVLTRNPRKARIVPSAGYYWQPYFSQLARKMHAVPEPQRWPGQTKVLCNTGTLTPPVIESYASGHIARHQDQHTLKANYSRSRTWLINPRKFPPAAQWDVMVSPYNHETSTDADSNPSLTFYMLSGQ